MLILKTVYISSVIYIFLSSIMALVFGLIGLGMIVLAIYMQIKELKLKKKGVPVNLKVKEIKERTNIVNGYQTTFEFEYNGDKREETISTSKKFKVGSMKKGIYLANKNSNILSVDGEGFYMAKGGGILLSSFGMLILFLTSSMIFGFPAKIILYVVLIYFGILFGILFLYPIISSKKINSKSKKDEFNQIYYGNANSNEYSSVDQTLVRYIPKYKGKKGKSNKLSFGTILLTLIFVFLGSNLTIIGIISTCNAINIKINYPSTIGTIINTYTYKVTDDAEESDLLGVKYTYQVDGQNYILDYKTGKGADFYSYKVGNKIKLYYEKNNPNNAVPKTELGVSVVPLAIGLLFIYFGTYNIINDRKKARLYKTYILAEEK